MPCVLKVLHTLCAFANDFHNLGGGYVVIGVAEDNGRPVLPPVGITPQEADRIQKELQSLGHSAIFPSFHPLAAPYVVDDKLVLVLWAPGGRNRAYRAKTSLSKDSTETAWYIRKNSSTVKATPWRIFKQTQIDVVWFPEGRGGDRFTEKEFRGPLHRMLRESLAYIEATFLSTTVVKRKDRAEADRVRNFPFEAIEEAVVNAVYHRDYTIREPVEVTITGDELTVLSYPGPDRSVKTSDLAKGRATSRRYRNRRIGEFLKELDLTEARASRRSSGR